MSAYIEDMSRYPLLSREDEAEIAVKARAGDRAARDRLVASNLRFVVKIAKQYQGMGLELSDLISEGNIGLIMAADRFDASKGNRFISYAVWWIKAMIRKALTERRDDIGMGALCDRGQVVSLDAVREQNEVPTELIGNEAGVSCTSEADSDVTMNAIDEGVTKAVQEELGRLSAKEAHVIKLRYGLTGKWMSLKEVGDMMHLTKEGVRQIEKRAFARLRCQKALEAWVA